MHILFLTQILPYPPNAGPRVKTWQVLRYLDRLGHRVTLVSYVRPEEAPFLPAVADLVDQVIPVPIRRSRLMDLWSAVRALLTGRPFLVERDDRAPMRVAVEQVIRRDRVDAMHADQVTMTQFAIPYPDAVRVFDAHNATWAILESARQGKPAWMRAILGIEKRAMLRYEGKIVRDFDHTLAVTTEDQSDLRQAMLSGRNGAAADPARIRVVPITVDVESYQRGQVEVDRPEILALGSLHYAPNAEGIRWFIEQVFPIVKRDLPDAHLSVVGKSPPSDFALAAERSGGSIEITGYVPETDPYFSRASVFVVPVLAGSGMRVRILEAMARGMPTVTTSLGAQGIKVQSGRELLIEDTAAGFAAAVIRLLTDRGLRQQLSQQSRRTAVESYDWKRALEPMAELYGQPVGDRPMAAT